MLMRWPHVASTTAVVTGTIRGGRLREGHVEVHKTFRFRPCIVILAPEGASPRSLLERDG